MSNKYRTSVIFIMAIFTVLSLVGCSKDKVDDNKTSTLPISENYFIFDTVVSVRVYDEQMNTEHFEAIEEILMYIDETMNRFKEKSEVASINKQAGKEAVEVSEETFSIIKTAKDYAIRSNGLFDPTIGPLVDLWAIGNGGSEVPAKELIVQAQTQVAHDKLILDEAQHAVYLTDVGMTLDLGAIAKGYAADQVAAYLKQEGFTSAIIDLGGNILAMGRKLNQDEWRIGIQSPEEKRGAHLGTIAVEDKTIVTSGVYERYFMVENQIYHHVLDPFTGYPSSNELASVTIVTDESMHADAMSTTVFLLGLEKGITFIEATENAEAIFVTEDHKVYVTSGLKNNFKLTREEYELVE